MPAWVLDWTAWASALQRFGSKTGRPPDDSGAGRLFKRCAATVAEPVRLLIETDSRAVNPLPLPA